MKTDYIVILIFDTDLKQLRALKDNLFYGLKLKRSMNFTLLPTSR